MSLLTRALDLATNPQNTKWIAPLLLVADAVLCGLIIENVACTLPEHVFRTQRLIFARH